MKGCLLGFSGRELILLTVYKVCYSCSAILPSTQLWEVQTNQNPVPGPMEVVQGMGQGTPPQVSTKSMENQLGFLRAEGWVTQSEVGQGVGQSRQQPIQGPGMAGIPRAHPHGQSGPL